MSEATIFHLEQNRLRRTIMPSDLRDASDVALVLAIARYRNNALAEAYRRHAGPVFGLAR